MSDIRRWVDELPRDSAARQLLVASKKVHSPKGSVDRGWQALSVTLGTATAMATLTTKALANVVTDSTTLGSTTLTSTIASTAPVITGSAITAKASLVSVVGLLNAKWVAVSVLVGVGALGTQALITNVTPRARDVHGPTTILSSTVPLGSALPPVVDQANPTQARVVSEALTASPTPPGSAEKTDTLAPVVVTTPFVKASRGSLLTKQAHEIARLKHLIDTGSSTEAILRLEASSRNNEFFAFSEERDALYIVALKNSGKKSQAKSQAARFILKYPKSPHVEEMRQLVRSE